MNAPHTTTPGATEPVTGVPHAGSTLALRLALGALGVLVGLYGAYLLVARQSGADLRSALEWLVGAAVVHDGVIAVASLVVAAGLTAVVRRRPLRAPIVVGGVVLSTTTILAIPMLGRLGARPDNPTLLDRNYTAGWFAFAAVVVVGVVVGLLLVHRGAGGDASTVEQADTEPGPGPRGE